MTDIADERSGLPTPSAGPATDRGRRLQASAEHDWTATVRSIIAAAEADDVYELEVRAGPLRIALKRDRDPLHPGSPLISGAAGAAPLTQPGLHVIEAPLAGIWYDSPSPGAAPYIAVGELVAQGAVIGLVETMKVFNEVTSDVSGIVRQVLVKRGDLVTAHAPLIAIDASGGEMTAPGDSQ